MKILKLSFFLFLLSHFAYTQEKKIELKFDVYPNPASDFVIIESNSENINEFDFQIHSIIGNKVDLLGDVISDRKIKFSVKEISNGYYFIIVANENSKYKKALRFLKK